GTGEKWELHLPGGIYAFSNKRELIISREKPKAKEKKSFFYTFTVPGEVEVKELGKKIRASVLEEDPQLLDDPKTAYVDYSSLGKNIIVRNRNDGDKFIPLGMKGSKKLQDFFVDEKIPSEFRDYVPVVESAGKIVWVGGHRIDDRAKVTKRTKKTVKFELI
ncbi:MAG: tRNA lysidine(34) synthetase TilS, partial [Candidatus Margulisiibacteriota bacterium]